MKIFSKIVILSPFLLIALLVFTGPVCGETLRSGIADDGGGPWESGSGGTKLQLAIRYESVSPFDPPGELRRRDGTGAGFHELLKTDTFKPLERGQAAFSDTKLLR